MLQKRVVCAAPIPVQRGGRSAQVGSEVGTGKEGDALLKGWDCKSLGFLLCGCPLGGREEGGVTYTKSP